MTYTVDDPLYYISKYYEFMCNGGQPEEAIISCLKETRENFYKIDYTNIVKFLEEMTDTPNYEELNGVKELCMELGKPKSNLINLIYLSVLLSVEIGSNIKWCKKEIEKLKRNLVRGKD